MAKSDFLCGSGEYTVKINLTIYYFSAKESNDTGRAASNEEYESRPEYIVSSLPLPAIESGKGEQYLQQVKIANH